MPENIYTKYNIDVNRLTRDYQKFPLQKVLTKSHQKEWEKIPKEEFVYLYIECNVPYKILAQYFNVSGGYIDSLVRIYNVKKSPKQWIKNLKKTVIERFGVENYAKTEECKEKKKQTNLQNLGVEYPAQSPIVQEKYKQTCLNLYGVENPSQSSIVQEKRKQTNLQNLGVEYPLQSPIVQEKMKQTNLQRHGVENYSQSNECKEKVKQTCLKHFGVENPAQSSIVQEKMKQTNLQRHGVENYSQSNEFKNLFKNEEFVKHKLEKEYETKKKNNSFGKSEKEEEIYNLLLTKFKEVKRQYHSDLYPFPCDFYIPEIDLYIEYQGYFQHGKELYLGTDEQKEIVKEWENESQTKPQYSRAIKTWTISDPIKRNTAKQNNLNWIEFFNMKEFTQWFESI